MSGAQRLAGACPHDERFGSVVVLGPRFTQRCDQQAQPESSNNNRRDAVGGVARAGIGHAYSLTRKQVGEQYVPAQCVGHNHCYR